MQGHSNDNPLNDLIIPHKNTDLLLRREFVPVWLKVVNICRTPKIPLPGTRPGGFTSQSCGDSQVPHYPAVDS